MLKYQIIATHIALIATTVLSLSAFAVDPEGQIAKPATSETQPQKPLQEYRAKRSLLGKDEINLTIIEPNFVCNVNCYGPRIVYEITQNINCRVEFGTTNVDAENVRVIVEPSYWSDSMNEFYLATSIAPDTYDFPHLSHFVPYDISWKKTIPAAIVTETETETETGCYRVDQVDYPLVNCKWKISATVLSYSDNTDTVTAPPRTFRGGQSHSSGAQQEGTQCEDIVIWQVQEPPESD